MHATAGEGNGNSKRKKLKSGKHVEVEEVLTQWMVQCQARCIPLCGPVIKEGALEIAKKLEVSDFSASNGWLD